MDLYAADMADGPWTVLVSTVPSLHPRLSSLVTAGQKRGIGLLQQSQSGYSSNPDMPRETLHQMGRESPSPSLVAGEHREALHGHSGA